MNGTKRARRYFSENSEWDDEHKEMLEKLHGIQKDIDALNVSAAQDIIKIEEVYVKKRKTHFEQRYELLKQIPKFWLTVFQNHPHISSILKCEEIPCLGHLNNVVVEENENIGSGYRIIFHFKENPFFENETITKEFIIKAHKPAVSTNTPILWKEGKQLAKPPVHSKGRKHFLGRRSFFSWIQDHLNAENDHIAELIKEDVWFNPLQYYSLEPDEGEIYDGNSLEMQKNGTVDDGDADEVEIIDEEEEVEEEEEDDENLYEEEIEEEELLEEDGNEDEVTVIVDEEDECENV